MKHKKLFVIIPILIVALVFWGFYWAFFDIQRIEGQKIIQETTSPQGDYTVTAYLNSGGATTGWAVLGTVTHNETGKTKNIYWQYECDKADIYWIDETTVSINGEELNVLKDVYDYRQ